MQHVNAMAQFNTNNVLEIDKYNAGLEFSRQQFNSNQEMVVSQSNVNWRRQMNTADTAGVNAANQQNVQNAFNLSNQSIAMLWQEVRDEAAWAHESGENALERALEIDLEKMKADAVVNAALARAGGEITNKIVTGTDWEKYAGEAWDWLTSEDETDAVDDAMAEDWDDWEW